MLMMLQLLFCNKLNKIVKQLVLNIKNTVRDQNNLQFNKPQLIQSLAQLSPSLFYVFIIFIITKYGENFKDKIDIGFF